MTELELYKIVKDNVFELHDDGLMFICPFNYEDFIKNIDIDSESRINCVICSKGCLCIDIHEFEGHLDGDMQVVINHLLDHETNWLYSGK